MHANAQVKYTGATPGADANTYPIFSTVTAFPGARGHAAAGLARLIVDIKHSQILTLNWYRSQDRGVTWNQLGTDANIAAPAATSSTVRDFLIEPYQDWKLELVNGGVAQTTFLVDMALVEDRAVAT